MVFFLFPFLYCRLIISFLPFVNFLFSTFGFRCFECSAWFWSLYNFTFFLMPVDISLLSALSSFMSTFLSLKNSFLFPIFSFVDIASKNQLHLWIHVTLRSNKEYDQILMSLIFQCLSLIIFRLDIFLSISAAFSSDNIG